MKDARASGQPANVRGFWGGQYRIGIVNLTHRLPSRPKAPATPIQTRSGRAWRRPAGDLTKIDFAKENAIYLTDGRALEEARRLNIPITPI